MNAKRKYEVTIHYTGTVTYIVEGTDRESAEDNAAQLYYDDAPSETPSSDFEHIEGTTVQPFDDEVTSHAGDCAQRIHTAAECTCFKSN